MIEEKRWTRELEEKVLDEWEKENLNFEFDPNAKKLVIVDTPPPYPGPFWHIAAAIHYALQDVFVRGLRMLGYSVFFPIGFDRNGIPVEWYVEKYEGIKPEGKTREEWIKICSGALDKYVDRMKNILKNLGIVYNWGPYFTDSEDYRLFTQKTFVELWKKGMIYEDYRPNNWCPRCKTTVADAEVEYKEKEGKLYYVKFDLEDGGQITIATTRPELIPACRLIIFHPEDERYKHLEGKKAIVPISGEKVPIIPRKEADPEFGTGLVMISSYGDFTDVRILRELNIEPKVIVDIDGRLKNTGRYDGLTVKEAREKIVEDLRREGRIEKEEKMVHKVPVHDKCKTEIEIIPMKEWYLKQVEFKDKIMEIAKKLKFIPEKYRQVLIDWINSVTKDWPISRRRYYATEIPMWYCKKCGYIYVPEKLDRYVQPWKEDPGIACPKCGAREWKGEERTFDTWMDSSVSVLYITKDFPEEVFDKAVKIRPQGKEIIRTWLYYTLLRTYQLKEKSAFDVVWITGYGVDEKGRKMSKSLGNVIYPEPIIEKYGSDAIRFFAVMETSIGDDFRISEQRIQGAAKFLTKLLNIARFISQFEKPEEMPELKEEDKEILEETKEIIKLARECYENLDAHKLAKKVRSFTWERFANEYIEKVKERARNGDKSAVWTMYEVLRRILLVLAPITPFITDFIWRKLYKNTSIHLEKIPEV